MSQHLYNSLDLWATEQIVQEFARQDELEVQKQVLELGEQHRLCGTIGEIAKQLANMGYVLVHPPSSELAARVDRDGTVVIDRKLPILRKLTEHEDRASINGPCSHGRMDCFECWWRHGRPA